MKRSLVTTAIFALLATPAILAAPGHTDATVSTSRYPTNISIGPAMYIPGGDTALPGFALSIATPATGDYPLYVGVDTGFYFATGAEFAGNIPVLATMYIEFAHGSKVSPLMGVSAGPSFGVGRDARPAVFGMVFKPGLNISLSNSLSLNIESRVGVLGSTFVFLPQITAAFLL